MNDAINDGDDKTVSILLEAKSILTVPISDLKPSDLQDEQNSSFSHFPDLASLDITRPIPASAPEDSIYLYQLSDGQRGFLHPTNVRWLLQVPTLLFYFEYLINRSTDPILLFLPFSKEPS